MELDNCGRDDYPEDDDGKKEHDHEDADCAVDAAEGAAGSATHVVMIDW